MAADVSQGAARDRFQVLSLDGGGILGIFTAALLAGLEQDLGRPVLSHFDLVVGTSTGGIIALGIGAGMTAGQIAELYVSEMKTIFPGPRGLRPAQQLVRSKYRPGGLEKVLRRAFGDTILGESQIPLVIPSFDLGENKVYLFKTPHHDRLRRDWKVPLWQVAMATSAAPTFFPAFSLPGDHVRLVDGGVWANNPAAVGVAEAVSMFGQPLDTIRVLSLGTTADPRARKRSLDRGGLLQWIRSPNVVNVLLTGQSTGAFTLVQHLLGSGNAHRLDPQAPAGLARLDGADARDLVAKASYHSRYFCPTFEAVFAGHSRLRTALATDRTQEAGDIWCTPTVTISSASCSAARSSRWTSPRRSTAWRSPDMRQLASRWPATGSRPVPRAKSTRRGRCGWGP